MTLAVALFGLFIVVLGLAGLRSPELLHNLMRRAVSQLGLYLIAGARLLLGVALLLSAVSSRAPVYLQVVGAVAIVGGIITPFFGIRRFEAILGWWRRRPAWVVRLWCVVVVAFGLSLVWAVVPIDRTD